jgi:hypothetical protein
MDKLMSEHLHVRSQSSERKAAHHQRQIALIPEDN